MNDSDFIVAFSVLDSGYKAWFFPAFGLVGCIFAFVVCLLISKGRPNETSESKGCFIAFMVGLFALWTVGAFAFTFADYLKARETLTSGNAAYVEGVVQNFVPMPVQGHATESFTVNGVPFNYSDYIVTAGFNNTSTHGGPIRQGLFVRIWYTGNEILKLEIRKDS